MAEEAKLKTISLSSFNLNKALNGATIAFSTNGEVSGKVSNYVTDFKVRNMSSITQKYSGQSQGEIYYFNELGECSDGEVTHNLFIVDVQIEDTKGTAASRGDADGDAEIIDINTLQPREHFAIAALRGIMFHIVNPLDLTVAQIDQICTKSFEIANGMMAAAAEARAESQEKPNTPENDKKEELEVNPDELTSNSDKILYNLYVQNNNKAIEEKARFDKLTGATYEDNKLSSVKGLKLHTDTDNPLITKLHPDSEIKKVAEVAKVTEITKLSEVTKVANVEKVGEVTKITDKVLVQVEGSVDANLASSDITLPVSGEVEVTNTVGVTGSVFCSNMLVEPVYVSVKNSALDVNVTNTPDVNVINMPSVPSEPVLITGTVSVKE